MIEHLAYWTLDELLSKVPKKHRPCRETIFRKIRSGVLPARRVGHTYICTAIDFDRALAQIVPSRARVRAKPTTKG